MSSPAAIPFDLTVISLRESNDSRHSVLTTTQVQHSHSSRTPHHRGGATAANLLFRAAVALAVNSLTLGKSAKQDGSSGSSSSSMIPPSATAVSGSGGGCSMSEEHSVSFLKVKVENDQLRSKLDEAQRELARLHQENDLLKHQVLQQALSTPAESSTIAMSFNNSSSATTWIRGEQLGEGAFGVVHLAMHSVTGEFFAVKEVHLTTADPQAIRAVEKELGFLKQLVHPNIVKYLGMNISGNVLHIYQEYVAGGSIHRVLTRFGPLQETVVVQFLDDILAGLEYLHKNCVIHRDIKGDNILLTLTGRAKLGDFGTAELWSDETARGNITARGGNATVRDQRQSSLGSKPTYSTSSFGEMYGAQGSALWLSPEVLRGERAQTQSDIWSVGCVAVEMISGQPPWPAFHDLGVMQQMFAISQQKGGPPIPSEFALSPDGHSFLRLCFTMDPSSRPSCESLRHHRWILETMPLQRHGTASMSTPPHPHGGDLGDPLSRSVTSAVGNFRVPKITWCEASGTFNAVESIPSVTASSAPASSAPAVTVGCSSTAASVSAQPVNPLYAIPSEASALACLDCADQAPISRPAPLARPTYGSHVLKQLKEEDHHRRLSLLSTGSGSGDVKPSAGAERRLSRDTPAVRDGVSPRIAPVLSARSARGSAVGIPVTQSRLLNVDQENIMIPIANSLSRPSCSMSTVSPRALSQSASASKLPGLRRSSVASFARGSFRSFRSFKKSHPHDGSPTSTPDDILAISMETLELSLRWLGKFRPTFDLEFYMAQSIEAEPEHDCHLSQASSGITMTTFDQAMVPVVASVIVPLPKPQK